MALILSVNDVSVGYKTQFVLDSISFELRSSEICAIVGINGVGKSTLLRTLAKLQPTIDGEILVKGKSLSDYTPLQFAKSTAIVLTEPLATKNLTVLELLALSRYPHTNWWGKLDRNDKLKLEATIKQFELNDFKTKKCYELSDGELQRVLIAKAMAQDTSLILLDEPTTHLDLFNKVQIFRLMQELAHKNRKTIVFTTHEINLAIQLCDKILILDGINNSFGEPSELIKNHHFTNLFPSDYIEFDNNARNFKVKK